MATYERRPLMSFKDKGGDKHLMYPITKAECVDGLDALLAGKETPSGAQEKVNIVQGNLNTHAANSGMHVTSSEKAAWDAKESQTGAQGKVDAVRQELSSHKTELSPHANSIYRKGECLSDATKSLLGLAATAVPDAAIAVLHNKLAISVPVGVIVMWSGAANAIPAGWRLCNGTNGTPDLRGRFVAGAGGVYAVGNTGGFDSVTLSATQLPSHGHSFSGSLSAGGDHSHSIPSCAGSSSGVGNRVSTPNLAGYSTVSTNAGGGHSHTLSGSIGPVGGNAAHENRPPYYALCYIMFKGWNI